MVEAARLRAVSQSVPNIAFERFDENTRSSVHEEYLRSIEPYRYGTGYRIPGEFVAAVGVKP